MAFRSDISALILGALQAQPLHGYEIVRRIRVAGGAGKLSEGQIYPYLHKLEAEGLVLAEWNTETGGAPRRMYQVTESGLKELDQHRELWKKFTAGVGSILNASGVNPEAKNV
jgi:PadR family transcriptional regulator, regulatory protein PadR